MFVLCLCERVYNHLPHTNPHTYPSPNRLWAHEPKPVICFLFDWFVFVREVQRHIVRIVSMCVLLRTERVRVSE